MMPTYHTGLRVFGAVLGGKNILPDKFTYPIGIRFFCARGIMFDLD
jgi:hypothetical protein